MSNTIIANRTPVAKVKLNGRPPAMQMEPPSVEQEIKEWSEIVDITPELAAQWIQDFQYVGQRQLSRTRLNKYVFAMKSGRFKTSEIRLVHAPSGVKNTNGNHRLHAVVESGVTIRANVYHSVVDDDQGVAEDYTCCDIHSPRNQNALWAATTMQSRSGLEKAEFQRFASAMGPLMGGFAPVSYTGSQAPELSDFGVRQEVIPEWFEPARAYFAAMSGADRLIQIALHRRTVICVGLVTFAYQPDRAQGFWRELALDDGLKSGDPRKTLYRFLIANEAKRVTPYAYSRYVAAAWNSWFAGKENKQLKVPDPTKPIVIAGTPYDGKAVYELRVD